MAPLRVYLVRHGETAENRANIVQGHLDTVLNEDGLKQAALVADALKDVPFSVAFSSDLKRAKSTAQKILEFHPSVKLQESEALRERFMGSAQGSTMSKQTRSALLSDKSVETRQELVQRAINWWAESLALLAGTPQVNDLENDQTMTNILVVTHGGFIIALLHEMLEEGYTTSALYSPPLSKCLNTAVAILEVENIHEPAVLTKYGDISHLLKPAVKEVVQENVDEVDLDV